MGSAIIVSHQAKQTPNILYILGLFPFSHGFYLFRVNDDPLTRYNMTQEIHLLQSRFTLAKFFIQLVLSQPLQDYLEILLVLLLAPRVYQHIINEH